MRDAWRPGEGERLGHGGTEPLLFGYAAGL